MAAGSICIARSRPPGGMPRPVTSTGASARPERPRAWTSLRAGSTVITRTRRPFRAAARPHAAERVVFPTPPGPTRTRRRSLERASSRARGKRGCRSSPAAWPGARRGAGGGSPWRCPAKASRKAGSGGPAISATRTDGSGRRGSTSLLPPRPMRFTTRSDAAMPERAAAPSAISSASRAESSDGSATTTRAACRASERSRSRSWARVRRGPPGTVARRVRGSARSDRAWPVAGASRMTTSYRRAAARPAARWRICRTFPSRRTSGRPGVARVK